MLELAGREALGERVGDLLELQTSLEAGRAVEIAADEEDGVVVVDGKVDLDVYGM